VITGSTKQHKNTTMKKFAIILCLLAGLLATLPAAETTATPKTDTIVWAGLDYSLVRLIGPGEFSSPETIFPGMLEAWNNLFLQERIQFVEKQLKKNVIPDIGGMTKVNQAATGKQIINSPGPDDTIDQSHITAQDIAKKVKSYKLENKSGLGAVFIVDRLVKVGKKGQGAVYVVYFDVASREVLFSERKVSNAVGIGFRNYWFRVVKDAEKTLSKYK
jgi:hypothetical protein